MLSMDMEFKQHEESPLQRVSCIDHDRHRRQDSSTHLDERSPDADHED